MAHTSKTYYVCYLVFMFNAIFYMLHSVWFGTNRLFLKIGRSLYDISAMPMLCGFIFSRFRATAADFCHSFSKNLNKSLNSRRKIKSKLCGTVIWGKNYIIWWKWCRILPFMLKTRPRIFNLSSFRGEKNKTLICFGWIKISRSCTKVIELLCSSSLITVQRVLNFKCKRLNEHGCISKQEYS